MLRFEAEVCTFSRNKLHRKHCFRKVLTAETAYLFALFQSFWKKLLKLLLSNSFFRRLEEVLNNFCKNELLFTDIFFEKY